MVCSAALHKDGELLGHQLHKVEKSHSSLLPVIGMEVCEAAGYTLKSLDAVALSSGPGSYTGLRIGAATAKGWCFGLGIPLIGVPSLDVLAQAVRGKFLGEHLLVPMMDARRMEVYLQVEDERGVVMWKLQPKILDEGSFQSFEKTTYLFGDGMPKFREVSSQQNLVFIDDIFPDAQHMGKLAYNKYQAGLFEDIAYFEPNYLKEWRTTTPKNKLAT